MTNTDATVPPCPECASEYAYELGALFVCPMCAHEWAPTPETTTEESEDTGAIRDAVGNVLQNGDDVVVTTSVRVAGGGGTTVKAGTKVRGITLTSDRGDGHDIDAKISGIGRLALKSSIVKKA